jgi:acyl-coenzyme A thioesterase PaaI-like protein
VPEGSLGELTATMRELQDVVAGADPPVDVADETSAQLAAVIDALRPWVTSEPGRSAGVRRDLADQRNTLLPRFVIDETSPDHVIGRVTFTRFYLGGNGAAHGGAVPLMFDAILGRLANSGERSAARTAYLHVNYRKITPIGPELRVEGTVDREDGRKRYLSGRLLQDGELVADAEGLFVMLLPGQP